MRLITTILLLLAALTAAPQPKHEVRAVWLTTIGGIDWPSSYAHDGMGIEAQQRQLCDMLDRLKAVNVNTVLLQTRVRATTIYPSDLEPWDGCLSGTPGRSPGYDALQYAIDECHRRGMELHAWVVTIPIGKWQSFGCRQLRRRYPRLVRRIGQEGYLNPEAPQTATYLADLCAELTERYDIDGIHLDYIRYPETWRGAKSPHHITRIVEHIHQAVKGRKPWVKISCSPIGKYDDLSRYSSNGWNAYSRVAQDAQGWLRNGLMDQLYPMLYFRDNNFYPFAIDWQEQNSGRTVAAGLATYMLDPRERDWPLGEMQRQLSVCRQIGMGHCHFRAKFLLDNVKGIYDYVSDFDRHPALIPPMTWLHSLAPTPPTAIDVVRTAEGDHIAWHGATDYSNAPYLLYNIYASTDEHVDTNNPANLVATRIKDCHIVVGGKRTQPLYYAVTALDRYGNESTPKRETTRRQRQTALTSELTVNNGTTLDVPYRQLFDARLLYICDMTGREVMTCTNRPRISIKALPDGMYQLYSLSRKRHRHRLGTFIVRRKR